MKMKTLLMVCMLAFTTMCMASMEWSPHNQGPPDNEQFSEVIDQKMEIETFTYSEYSTECLTIDNCMTAALCNETLDYVIISDVHGESNLAIWWDYNGSPIAYWDDYSPGQTVTFSALNGDVKFTRGDGEYIPIPIYLALHNNWKSLNTTITPLANQEDSEERDPGWATIQDLTIEQRYAIDDYLELKAKHLSTNQN